MTRTYVVRVVLEHHNKEQFNNPFLESLRYAGLVELHSDDAVAAPAWGERS